MYIIKNSFKGFDNMFREFNEAWAELDEAFAKDCSTGRIEGVDYKIEKDYFQVNLAGIGKENITVRKKGDKVFVAWKKDGKNKEISFKVDENVESVKPVYKDGLLTVSKIYSEKKGHETIIPIE